MSAGRVMKNKLAVGVAALVLATTVGAVAWAAPEDATSTTATTTVAPQEGPERWGGGPGMRGRGMGGHERMSAEDREQMQEQRDARRDAFLKLIREKMTPEEQKQLDALTATADQQREALEQAREDLFKTSQAIRDLVGTYFPVDGLHGPDGTTPTTVSPEGNVQ